MSSRFCRRLYIFVATWSSLSIRKIYADLVLSQKILSLSINSADLSSIVKASQPPSNMQELGFDILEYEPRKAIVAKKDGYCYLSYRGSSMTWITWDAQDFGREKICFQQKRNETTCCSTRIGFAKAYNSTSHRSIENAIRQCAQGCSNPDECVVLGGHSEGGAVAVIAALDMADLNPYVITFGQPSTIDTPCSMLSAERLFRFVNTKVSSDGGITYDPVPFIQGLGADNFGYMIFLGDDSQRVASIGLATRTADFHPNILFGLQAHSMVKSHAIPGYLDRLHNLFNNNAAFPIHANGFENGAICNEDMECQSGKCRLENKHSSEWTTCVPAECRLDDDCRSSDICADGGCISKLQSCMTCQNDADCASGKCLWNLCAGSSGLIDNNCGCKMDTDCTSHRCRFGFCEAKLPIGAVCISSEDCASGVCVSLATTSNNASSTSLLCQDPRKVGFGAVNLVPNETPRLTRATMSWARMLTVVFCCTILTFTIVKRFLSCRRKGYSTIPNAELYV